MELDIKTKTALMDVHILHKAGTKGKRLSKNTTVVTSVTNKTNAFRHSFYASFSKYTNSKKIGQEKSDVIVHKDRPITAKYEKLPLNKSLGTHKTRINNDSRIVKHAKEDRKNLTGIHSKDAAWEIDKIKADETEIHIASHAAKKIAIESTKFDTAINILNNLSNAGNLTGSQNITLTSAEVNTFNSSINAQINNSVSNAANLFPKTPTLSINLYPPKLGRVFLKLSVSANGMILRLSAASSITVHLLQDKIDDLKDSLSKNGITISKILVEVIPQISSTTNQNGLNNNNGSLNWNTNGNNNNHQNFSGGNHNSNRETFNEESKDGKNEFNRQQFNTDSLNLWI